MGTGQSHGNKRRRQRPHIVLIAAPCIAEAAMHQTQHCRCPTPTTPSDWAVTLSGGVTDPGDRPSHPLGGGPTQSRRLSPLPGRGNGHTVQTPDQSGESP